MMKKYTKRKSAMPTGLNVVKPVVTAGVTLGVGATMLGSMGQGAIATHAITPAANMLGPIATAGMGMGILDMVAEKTRKKKK